MKRMTSNLTVQFALLLLLGITGAASMPGMAQVGLAQSQPSGRSQAGEWVSFKSDKGGFSVSMPAPPTERMQTVSTGGGDINTYLFSTSLNNGTINYTVSYMDLPKAAASVPENVLLEALSGGITGDQRLKVLSERAIKLDNYNGREFKIESPTRSLVQHRTYIVNQRVYQIAAEVPVANANTLLGDVERFLSSFKLL